MPQILIEEVQDGDLKTRPVFAQIEKRQDNVRRRAFELFELRGRESGREVEDWLRAEREMFGWPLLKTQENDYEFEFQVPLDDLDVSHVTVIVTPTGIIVHAKSDAENQIEDADALSDGFPATEMYRRIELSQPIRTERTRATFDKGRLLITAEKAETLGNPSWTELS